MRLQCNKLIMYFISALNLALASPDDAEVELMQMSVKSSFKPDLPPHLIITSSSLKLLQTIGQGYFINDR